MLLNKGQIFILDDEGGIRASLEAILGYEGYHVKSFGKGTELLKYMDSLSFSAPAAALLDLRLPDIPGIEVMKKIKERSPETEVVMFTGQPDMTTAIESINAGAYAYILKPYNMDEIKNVLVKIFEKQKLVQENRELTQKLQEWNKELEHQVYQRTQELQESYKKLQALHEIRTQFIAVMSHELRTPSTAILGFADTLRERWDKLSKEKIHQYLMIVSNETERMVSLMSEIFEISRIQEGNLELEMQEADLAVFLENLVEDFRRNDPEHSYAFRKVEGPATVRFDPFYFKMAVSHLISNAVKYTPPQGKIIILSEKKNGSFTVQIEDEGAGIPSGLKEKIFEPFFRLMDDINRRTPGAGLGLTIARGIMEAMGGTVKIGEKVTGGQGCAVVISVPLSVQKADPSHA